MARTPKRELTTLSKFLPPEVTSWLPLAFFGALLFSRIGIPEKLVFDEVHYVPAAKALIELKDNINWVHPPFGKLVLGLGWLLLTKLTGILGEPEVFRFVSCLFGLWALWGVRAWMLELRFSERAAQAALWLTGFNFLWFVQSKTAMLDMIYIALALWGLLYVYSGYYEGRHRFRRRMRFWVGWALLGLAAATKWSTLPFVVLAFLFGARTWPQRILGCVVVGFVYAAAFVPLGFLTKGAVPITNLIDYHQTMLNGFASINAAPHPYSSHWWEWPTLLRPMWYAFETESTGQRCIWAGGNPVLYWLALPFLVLIAWFGVQKEEDRAARMLSLLYWVPLLFWLIAPRKLQMYYYYVPSSFWVGPIVVWAYERFIVRGRFKFFSQGRPAPEARRWILIGFVLLCAALFLYFLPIMDARLLPPGRYQQYMWLRNWI